MEKISGRRAITMLAEISAGIRTVTDQEKRTLYERVKSLRDWLVEKKNKTPEEADIICKKLFADDHKALISKPKPVNKPSEDTLAHSLSDSFTKRLEFDFQEEQFFKDALDEIYGSPDLWRTQEEKFLEVMIYLFQAKKKFGSATTEQQKNHLIGVRTKINTMRYGQKHNLSYRQWAICYNTVNELLGITDRKILFKQITERDPQEETNDLALPTEIVDTKSGDEMSM